MVEPPTQEVMSLWKRFPVTRGGILHKTGQQESSMSNAIFNRVRHAQVTASQKIILLLLADYADDTGCTNHYAPIERMAFESCLTERTVISVIKQLEEAKIIHVHRVNGASSVYYINPDFDPEPRQSIKENPFTRKATPETDNTGLAVNFTPETVSPLKLTAENCSQFHPTHENDCKKMQSISPIPSIPSLPSNNHQGDAVEKPKAKREKFDQLSAVMDLGCSKQLAEDWLKVRKAKRAPLTETALKHIVKDAQSVGLTAAQAIEICIAKNWVGFNPSWTWQDVSVTPASQNQPHPYQPALSNNGYVAPVAPVSLTQSGRGQAAEFLNQLKGNAK